MWISKSKWQGMEKRIADLEKNQTRSADMVKAYIEDSESMSNKLSEQIKNLPEIILKTLQQYGLDK